MVMVGGVGRIFGYYGLLTVELWVIMGDYRLPARKAPNSTTGAKGDVEIPRWGWNGFLTTDDAD